ncbi:hypothetical protein O181_044610 [Austropuccinia psidii MF-1]|uniref:Uncharacterized protein n=1 Tax=Austropuccinia psidii MF-1 TaxID=1389203 RepID=A0A9Q3HKB8_9BASI|nr:hypothetical protein [Austropuccinia psidii MF-1]
MSWIWFAEAIVTNHPDSQPRCPRAHALTISTAGKGLTPQLRGRAVSSSCYHLRKSPALSFPLYIFYSFRPLILTPLKDGIRFSSRNCFTFISINNLLFITQNMSGYNYGSHFTGNSHNNELSNLEHMISSRDELISTLMKKVELLEHKSGADTQKKTLKTGKSKQHTIKHSNSTPAKKAKNTPRTSNSQKIPTPPMKRSPLQMLMCEVPDDFIHTKEALYAHIKILWGMLEKNTLPPAPDRSLLKEFYGRFSTNEQVLNVATSNTGANLIGEKEVKTLRDAHAGRLKVGKHIINLEEFYILYIHSMLAKLGIRVWAPDLEEAPDSLYNEACRTAALMTFRQVACSGAYHYIKANLMYCNNLSLLKVAYNHFVHYLMAETYKIENKESGKTLRNKDKKVVQKRRLRVSEIYFNSFVLKQERTNKALFINTLCHKRYKFAVGSNFPQRYLKVLNDVNAHSDDEFDEKLELFTIKKLPYRSESANSFFRSLDLKMKQANKLAGKKGQKYPRCQLQPSVDSELGKAPSGMPIDFYSPEWFNEQDYAIRSVVAQTKKVAFIPVQTLQAGPHPNEDETISDSAFNKKYWASFTEPYNLYHEVVHSGDEEDADEDSSNQFSDGDVIKQQGLNNGDEESEDEDEEDNHPGVYDQWTRDIDEEMEDAFDNICSTSQFISEGELGPKVWQ